MEINSNLLEKVRQKNTEFRDLHEEHTALKLKVKALNKTILDTVICAKEEIKTCVNCPVSSDSIHYT